MRLFNLQNMFTFDKLYYMQENLHISQTQEEQNAEKSASVLHEENVKQTKKEKRQEKLQRKLQVKKEKKEKKLEKKAKLKSIRKQIEQARLKGLSNWFRLDNAALVYPSAGRHGWTFVYRFSAVLKEEVNPELLQQAVNDCMPRFPTFNVTLKNGLFWHYFDQKASFPKVQPETEFPCSYFELQKIDHLVRILYFHHRISVEIFHSVSDGRGTLTFFNTLLYRYFSLQNKPLTGTLGCLNYLDIPSEEETQDAFMEVSNNGKCNPHKEQKALKIKGTPEDEGKGGTTYGLMSARAVKSLAAQYKTKLSIFLCSLLAFVVHERNIGAKRPVKISVPIDLRPFFGMETLRNFSSYINVKVGNEQEKTLEEIIEIFTQAFQKINKEYLLQNINANTRIQKNICIKLLPLPLKDIAINLSFKLLGEDYQTMAFSNIGVVKAPPEFEQYISHYEVNLGRPKYNTKGVAAICFQDNLVISFNSKIKERVVEKEFFRFLTSHQVSVYVYTDRRDLYAK